MYKLILFDYNGTLVNTPFVDGQPLHILPGRPEKLATLREAGTLVGVCTNQGGPIWRSATGNVKYPTAIDVAKELSAIITLLPWPGDFWCVSLYERKAEFFLHQQVEDEIADASMFGSEPLYTEADKVLDGLKAQMEATFALRKCPTSMWVGTSRDWRKPAPGMLTYSCQLVGVAPSDALYVGDMDDDQRAAEAAGMPFLWAHDFFAAEEKR